MLCSFAAPSSATPLLPSSTTVLSTSSQGQEVVATITAAQTREFTVYSINLKNQTTERQWAVRKRFSEFAELDKTVRRVHPAVHTASLKGKLPAKTMFGKLERSVVETRRMGLEVYLNLCIKVLPPSVNDELKSFIEMPSAIAAAFQAQLRRGADGEAIDAGAPGAKDTMPTCSDLSVEQEFLTLGAAADGFPAYRQAASRALNAS